MKFRPKISFISKKIYFLSQLIKKTNNKNLIIEKRLTIYLNILKYSMAKNQNDSNPSPLFLNKSKTKFPSVLLLIPPRAHFRTVHASLSHSKYTMPYDILY